MSETLGQQVVVENMPGGGGLVGSLRVSQAAVDSHMFVLASIGTHAIGYSMHSKPMYHPANDFQPVAFVADAPLMLMTKKDLPPNNLAEFIAYTKAQSRQDVVLVRRQRHVLARVLRDAESRSWASTSPTCPIAAAARLPGRDRRPHRLHLHNYISIGAARREERPGQGAGDTWRASAPRLLPDLPTADQQG